MYIAITIEGCADFGGFSTMFTSKYSKEPFFFLKFVILSALWNVEAQCWNTVGLELTLDHREQVHETQKSAEALECCRMSTTQQQNLCLKLVVLQHKIEPKDALPWIAGGEPVLTLSDVITGSLCYSRSRHRLRTVDRRSTDKP